MRLEFLERMREVQPEITLLVSPMSLVAEGPLIQVNGRVRDRVEVPATASEEELIARARESERVQEFLDGKEIRKEIVVPGKLVNLVIG